MEGEGRILKEAECHDTPLDGSYLRKQDGVDKIDEINYFPV